MTRAAVERRVEILDILTEKSPLSAAEIACERERLGMGEVISHQIRHLLRSLRKNGFVEVDPERGGPTGRELRWKRTARRYSFAILRELHPDDLKPTSHLPPMVISPPKGPKGPLVNNQAKTSKAALRAKLRRDTERWLAAGNTPQVGPSPGDGHVNVVGRALEIGFNYRAPFERY